MSKPAPTLAEIIASGRTLLNENEAAIFLDTTIGTLQVWRSTGRYGIPFVKIGRSVRYKLADLEAWIESRTHISHSGHKSTKPHQSCTAMERRQAVERGFAAPPQAALPPATNRGGKIFAASNQLEGIKA